MMMIVMREDRYEIKRRKVYLGKALNSEWASEHDKNEI